MERRQQWLSRLKSEFGNSPLVSNVAFGFILMGLEKLVELEFECPCDPKWNGLFSSAFFVIPAIMAFMLMLIIQDCRYDLSGCPRTVSISSLVPPIVWLILLFLDGQYFACALTDWNGSRLLLLPGYWYCSVDIHLCGTHSVRDQRELPAGRGTPGSQQHLRDV
uniref:Uncharacterized protein n=1 Tax=Hucho hucho TaxID=62062 RepID=A0A4W5KSV5_9TELE